MQKQKQKQVPAQFSRFISTNVKCPECKPEKCKIAISHWIHYKYNFTARSPRNTVKRKCEGRMSFVGRLKGDSRAIGLHSVSAFRSLTFCFSFSSVLVPFMLFARASEAHSKIYCLQLEVRHEFYLFACKSDLCDPKDVRA